MPRAAGRSLALSRELVRAVHPAPVPDSGAPMTLLTDAEIDVLLDRSYAEAGRPREVWVFAYGSLMWRPEVSVDETRIAAVAGWHRRFCLWQWRSRGSRERPGMMLALDRGGSCRGLAYRLAGADLRDRLRVLWQRELRGNGYRVRWLPAATDGGTVRAVTFVINRDSERYAGRVDDAVAARHIATACGSRGPSAEYLCETVLRCHELGIRDRHLLRLQALVADHLRAFRTGPAE
ncbi:MAG: gamma-glutamylcyclotransferase [Alphaproteobacteria bacterium]|nr:gamma-glutamylcyclotransferase [Alphaproteobacteria bacterium]